MASGLTIKHKRELHPWTWLFWIVLLGLFAAAVWFGYQYFTTGALPPGINAKALQADPAVDESVVSKEQVAAYNVKPDMPRYISIPSLSITNARVYPVGLKPDNQVATPKNISDTGWYTKSAKPGQGYGAVLISGHAGGITRDGVFAKLGDLKRGDTIIITRGDNKQFTYRVESNTDMSLKAFNDNGTMASQPVVESEEGLNLVTTNGKWVPKYQQFDGRRVLRAVRVN